MKYINVQANSTLEKYTIGLETDLFWYVPISEKTNKALCFESPITDGYIKIDKETMAMKAITPAEYREVKACQKK